IIVSDCMQPRVYIDDRARTVAGLGIPEPPAAEMLTAGVCNYATYLGNDAELFLRPRPRMPNARHDFLSMPESDTMRMLTSIHDWLRAQHDSRTRYGASWYAQLAAGIRGHDLALEQL